MAYLKKEDIYKPVSDGGFGFSTDTIISKSEKIYGTHVIVKPNTKCIFFPIDTPQDEIINFLSTVEIDDDKSKIEDLKLPKNKKYDLITINQSENPINEDLTQLLKNYLKEQKSQPDLMSRGPSSRPLTTGDGKNHYYRVVKLLDFNLGSVSKNPKNKLFAEIEIISYEKNSLAKQEEKNFFGYGLTLETNEFNGGRLFIEQDLLVFDPYNLSIINFGEEENNNNFITKFQTYSQRLEKLKERNREQPNLNFMDWEQNFINSISVIDQEWYYRPSSVVRSISNQLSGDVFYNKKYASYCTPVILNIDEDTVSKSKLENKEIFSYITEEDRRKILDAGLATISKFLNINYGSPLAITSNMGDIPNIAEILDINVDQDKKGQKLKFLVSVAHRKIAARINDFVDTVDAFSPWWAAGGYETLLAAAKGGPNVWENVINEVLESFPDNYKTSDVWKNLTTNWGAYGLGKLDETLEKFNEILNQNLFPGLADLVTNIVGEFLTNSDPLDNPIDKSTPYIFINYSKDIKDKSKKLVEDLQSSLDVINSFYDQEVLEQYEVNPPINLGAIKTSCMSLYDNLYNFGINKIISAESIGETLAEEKILGVAIYFFGTYDNFGSYWFEDLPEFMKVIGLEVFYKKNDSSEKPKTITVGSTKQLEISNITELSNKEVLYLFFKINTLLNKEAYDKNRNLISNPNYIEVQNRLDFSKNFIKPPRDFIWSPKGDQEDDGAKCFENIVNSLDNELKRQTADIRSSLLQSAENISKTLSLKTLGDSFEKMGEDLSVSGEDILPTLLTNIDIATLLTTLIECLKKKGIPYEELKALIDLLIELIGEKRNLLCLIPPIKLPQIPLFDFSFKVSSVDIVGIIYKEARKAIIKLMNDLILEYFKLLLNSILQCDGDFPQTNDDVLNDLFKPRDALSDSLENPEAPPDNKSTSTSSKTNTEIFNFTNNSSFPLLNREVILKIVLQESLPLVDSISAFVEELIILLQFITENLETYELINLLTGKLSDQVYWLIREEVESSENNQYPVINKSGLLLDRQKTASLFSRLGTLLNQSFIEEITTTVQRVETDIDILCADNQREIDVEKAVIKYGESKTSIIKEKIVTSQLNTIEILERVLSGANLADFLPPLRSRINDDGSIAKGLLPDTPHQSQISGLNQLLESDFSALKKSFNEELTISKFSQISNTIIQDSYSQEQTKKIYNIDEWNDERDKPKQKYYKNRFVVNEGFLKSLNEKYVVDTGNLRYDKFYFENTMPVPTFEDKIKEIDSLENFDGKKDLLDRLNIADDYLKSIKIDPNFISLISRYDPELDQDAFLLTIQNTKLFGTKPDGTYNEVKIIGYKNFDKKTINLLKNINYPENFGVGTSSSKAFARILYNNNIDINLKKHKLEKFDYDKDVMEKLFFLNYKFINKKISSSFIKNINESKLLTLDLNSPLNILNMQLESYQTNFCIKNGFKDTHLLGLEEEKKQIIDFFTANTWKDPDPPLDGGETENLNAIMFGKLISYLNIYFKIFVYDFYLRGYYVFNSYSPLDIDEDIMSEFLYGVFLNDKYCQKLLKYTKNGKFIRFAYERLENKTFISVEESVKYFIKKTMKFASEKLTQKLLKSGFTSAKNDIFENFWNGLPEIIVNDETKEIEFKIESLVNNNKGNPLGIEGDNLLFAKIKKGEKYYLGSFANLDNYQGAVLSYDSETVTKDYYREDGSVGATSTDFVNSINVYKYKWMNKRGGFSYKYILTILTRVDAQKFDESITAFNYFKNIDLDKNSERNKLVKQVFKDLFKSSNELTFLNIACITQSSFTKDVDIVFNNSKIRLLRRIEYLVFNGYDYVSDDAENDASSFELSLAVKAALNVPSFIIKAVSETIDPNIAFSSKIVTAIDAAKQFIGSLPGGKQVADNIPKIKLPTLSLPLGFTFPFIFTPFTLAYLALWTDENENTKNQEMMSMDSVLGSNSLCKCDVEPELDEDIIEFFNIRKQMLIDGVCVPPPITKNYTPKPPPTTRIFVSDPAIFNYEEVTPTYFGRTNISDFFDPNNQTGFTTQGDSGPNMTNETNQGLIPENLNWMYEVYNPNKEEETKTSSDDLKKTRDY